MELFEQRNYTGQTPGSLTWLLGGAGLSILNQMIVMPFAEAGTDLAQVRLTGAPSSGGEAAGGQPFLSLPEPEGPPPSPPWYATVLPPAETWASLSPRQSIDSDSEGDWTDDLLGDALAGPLDGDPASWLTSDQAEPGANFAPDLGSDNPRESGGSGGGGGAPRGPGDSGNVRGPLTGPGIQGSSQAGPTSLAGLLPFGNGSPPPPGGSDGQTDPGQNGVRPHLPLRFEANLGQKDPRVQYQLRGQSYNLFLTATGMTLVLNQPQGNPTPQTRQLGNPPPPPPPDRYAISMLLVGANSLVSGVGVGQLPGVSNYFAGHGVTQSIRNVHSYGKVSYQGVYPGIDLLYYGDPQGQVEYDFTVAPGSKPGVIQLAFPGTQSVSLDKQGNLLLTTPFGNVTEHAPIAYQMVNGVRGLVSAQYVVPDAAHVGFQVGAFDPTLPLVIDPSLAFSTFLGGSDNDEGTAVAANGKNVYVVGSTRSNDFPLTLGRQSSGRTDYDAFISEFDTSGQLVYSTYLGGSGDDGGFGVAVDNSGNAYVTGQTASSQDFPVTSNAYRTSFGGGTTDAFLVKLDPNGSLLYGTYFGGSGNDSGQGIAVDGTGNAYLVGTTFNSDGSSDAFVTELAPNGQGTSDLVFSTYLGRGGGNTGSGIGLDNSVSPPNILITGATTSPAKFATTGAFQTNFGGGTKDAFVVKYQPGGTLAYATYLGGSGDDTGYGIAVDSSGNAYVTGSTSSSDFPTQSPYQGVYRGGDTDTFVAEVNPGGKGIKDLILSTFLGGTGADAGSAIALDSLNNIYVTGYTNSANFPNLRGAQLSYGGSMDAFATMLPAGGGPPVYSTFLGGTGDDAGMGVAVDASGSTYITGSTASADFPTLNAWQPNLAGGTDAFLTKLNPGVIPNSPNVNLQLFNQLPATEGIPTGLRMLGSFTYDLGQLSNYSAMISWGDGFTSQATIPQNPLTCCGNIQGTHPYAEEGAYTIQVQISYQANGQTTTVATQSTAILVQDAPLTLTSTSSKSISTTAIPGPSGRYITVPLEEGMPLQAVDANGVLVSVVVASFSDANPGSHAADFGATIDWGDGSTTQGDIRDNASGNYDVLARSIHAYAEEGGYTITVRILDDQGGSSLAAGGSMLTIQSGAAVKKSPLIAFSPINTIAYCSSLNSIHSGTDLNLFFPGPVGFFSAGFFDREDEFRATIDWGDGTITAADLISGNAGAHSPNSVRGDNPEMPTNFPFGVVGHHLYSGTTAQWTGRVTVMDVKDGSSISWTLDAEGRAIDDACTDLPANIGGYNNPSLTIAGVGSLPNQDQSTPIIEEKSSGTITLGNYTNSLPNSTLTRYAIDWNDGSYDAEMHDPAPSSGPIISSHTYDSEGDYNVRIFVLGTTTTTTFWNADHVRIHVSDAPLRDITQGSHDSLPGVSLNLTQGQPFNSDLQNTPVFTFRAQGTAQEFKANIAIPVGGTSYPGNVRALPGGDGFGVYLPVTLTYSSPSNILASVEVQDDPDNQGNASPGQMFFGTIVVNPATGPGGNITATGAVITGTRALDGSGLQMLTLQNVLLATITDSQPSALNQYHASVVDWGDGQTSSTAIVTPGLNGQFYVYGSHTYRFSTSSLKYSPAWIEGNLRPIVTITKDNAPPVRVVSTVQVVRAGVGVLAEPLLAVFHNRATEATGVDTLVYNVGYYWGDQGVPPSAPGALSIIPNGPNPTSYGSYNFGFAPQRVYSQAGLLQYYTQYYDDLNFGISSGGIPSLSPPPPNPPYFQVQVAPAPTIITASLPSGLDSPPGSGILGTINQPLGSMGTDGHLTGTVALATFRNPDPGHGPSSFSATIFWGDGTQSSGSVQTNPGNSYTVLGDHTYTRPGVNIPITVSIQDSTPGAVAVLARTSATVLDNLQIHQRQPGTRLEVGTDGSADGGQVTVAPNIGALQIYQPLDFRLNHDSSLDGFVDLDGNPLQGMITGDDRYLQQPAGASAGIRGFGGLVYSSDTVSPRPIAEVDAAFDPNLGVPSQLTGELFFAGVPQQQAPVSFDPATGHQAGDTYVLAIQVGAPVTQTGVYAWSFHVHAAFNNGQQTQDKYYTGTALVVSTDQSQFGAGWTLYGLNQLFLAPGGALMTYGSGAAPRFFAYSCDGSQLVSPPDDFGTLSADPVQTGLYYYRSNSGVTWTYDARNTGGIQAVLTKITDPHGLVATFTYDSSQPLLLNGIQWPDGTATITSSPTAGQINEPGNRTLGLQFQPANYGTNIKQLAGITDVDGTLRTFTYDPNAMGHHRLVNFQSGLVNGNSTNDLNVTFMYDSTTSALTGVDRGQGTTWGINPASIVPLRTGPPGPPTAGLADVVAKITDPRGIPTTLTLDVLGWVVESDTADGSSAFWKRNASEQVNLYLDPLRRATVYRYGQGVGAQPLGGGDLIEVDYPDGGIALNQYDGILNRKISYQDPDHNITSYSYNASGDLVTITDAKGQTIIQTWDTSRGLLTAVTDQRGNATSYGFFPAPSRLLQTKTDAQPATYTYNYDAAGYRNYVRDPLGNLTTMLNDPRGRVVRQWDALNNPTSFAYNSIGLITGKLDALLRQTSYQYDSHGWQTTVVEAVGAPGAQRTALTTYDAAGNVLSVSSPQQPDLNPDGSKNQNPIHAITSYGYDVLNRPTTMIEAYGNTGPNGLQRTTTTLYDAVGNVLTVSRPQQYDANGSPIHVRTSYAYDARDRRAATIDAYGTALQRTTVTAYDAAGNVLAITDPRSVTTRYNYDALNRQTTVIEAYGIAAQQRTTSRQYDPAGNVLSISKPQGYDLDIFGVPVANPVHLVTSYGYDQVNRPTTMIEAYSTPPNPLQRTTVTGYDQVGNVRSVTRNQNYDANPTPVFLTTTYDYDVLNRPMTMVEAKGTPLARTTVTGYDKVGNVLTVTHNQNYDNGSSPVLLVTSNQYDALNRRTTVIADATHIQARTVTAYDAADNVIAVTDPRGFTTAYNYDLLNRQTTMTDAVGQPLQQRTTTTIYDAADNVLSISKPQGYDLDANGQTTVAYHVATSYAYDALNRPTTVTEAVGTTLARTTATSYDPNGNVLSITDPAGVKTQYGYDALNRRSTITEAAGVAAQQRTTTLLYDAANNLLAVSKPQAYDLDANGQPVLVSVHALIQYGYDILNHPTTVTEAVGGPGQQRTTTMGYDAANNVILVSAPQQYDLDPLGHPITNPYHVLTSTAYDVLNRPVTITEAVGVTGVQRTTSKAYDAADNVIQITDPRNVISRSAYDTLNRPTTLIEAVGLAGLQRTTTMLYDAVGNVLTASQPQGYDLKADGTTNPNPLHVLTSYGYDALNRRTTVIADYNGLNATTVTGFDAANNVIRVADPLQHVTTLTVDALNRTIAATDPLNHVTSTVYTAVDQVLSTIDATGQITSYAYNALRQQTVQIAGYGVLNFDGSITTYGPAYIRPVTLTYDAANNVLTQATPAGTTAYAYDLLNRRVLTTDAKRGLTNQGYDAANNLTSLVDPSLNLTLYSYDALNRRTEMVDPLNRMATYLYDPNGNLISTTDRDGRRRDFAYDGLNRLTTETWFSAPPTVQQVGPPITYSYDAANNLLSAGNGGTGFGLISMSYDHLNRTSAAQDVWGLLLTDTYNLANRRTQVQDPFGGITSSTYDNANRLQARELRESTTTVPYDIQAQLNYDPANRLTTLAYLNFTSGAWQTSATGVLTPDNFGQVQNYVWTQGNAAGPVLLRGTYTYDNAGRLTSDQRTVNTTPSGQVPNPRYSYQDNLAYDALGQLTTITSSDALVSTTDQFDANGNPTAQNGSLVTATYNQVNQDANWVYQYDNEGNLIGRTSQQSGGVAWSYTYDNANRLVQAQSYQGSQINETVSYSYDALGRLVQRSDQVGSQAAVVTRYAYDGLNIWADLTGSNGLERWYLRGDQVDQLFARVEGPATDVGTGIDGLHWYVQDRLGSVIDLFTSDGRSSDEWARYEGFKGITVCSCGVLAGKDRYGFTGREVDFSTGLQYNRGRWYDPNLGRFISQDPLGLGPDTNPYRYVHNSPGNATDPSGLAPWYKSVWNYTGGLVADLFQEDSRQQQLDQQINSWRAEQGLDPLAPSPSVWSQAGQAAQEGLVDGSAIVANTFTFGQIDSLNNYTQRVIAENGGLYVWANVSAQISREAVITLATLGIGSAVGAAGRAGINTLLKLSPTVGNLVSKAATLGRLAQPIFAGMQAYQVGSGLVGAYQAYQDGDAANAVLGLSRSAFNSIGLFSSVRESANLFRAASKGWSGLSSYLLSCFAAGTPLLTPDGSKRIEHFRVGDRVLSRSELTPDGPLETKVVEEVFNRTGRILNLHVGGQVIRTTREHPFFVQGKGWLTGGELRVGDLLASHDGQQVVVEAVEDAGEVATLFNLRIADHHTYFVGSKEWGFSVWAHNACVYQAVNPATGEVTYTGVANRGMGVDVNQRLASAAKRTGHPADIIQGLENVSSREAESVEATLIRFHGRQRYGGTLMQSMPGVNVSTPESYRQAIDTGTKLLNRVNYPGFEDPTNIVWQEPPRF